MDSDKLAEQLTKELENLRRRLVEVSSDESVLRDMILSNSIIENITVGIAFLDNDLILRKYNRAYANLIELYTPFTPEQALGMSYFDFVPGSREQMGDWFRQAMESGKAQTRHGFELKLVIDGREETTYWDTSMVPLMGTKGDPEGLLVLAQDRTEEKRTDIVLQHRLMLERTVANISRNFVSISPSRLDEGINEALRLLGESNNVDRSYLFLISPDGEAVTNTHEWCAEGIEPQIDNLQDLPASLTPWWMEKLRHFEPINVQRVAEMPPEADCERQILEAQAIKSVLVVPVASGGVLYGFLGFDSVQREKSWSEDDIEILRVASEIIASALQRAKVEEALHQRLYQQERLLETARHLTGSLDLQEVLYRIGAEAKELLQAFGCAIYLLEDDEETLTPVVAIEPPYEEQILATPLNIHNSFTGYAVRAGRGVVSNDAPGNKIGFQLPGTPDYVKQEERVIAAPFIAEGKVWGAMCLNRLAISFTEEDLVLAETFAAYAATAIKNAQLYTELHREAEERKRTAEALRSSEEQFRALTEHSADIIARLDRQHRHLYMSPAALDIVGIRPEEFIGKTYRDLGFAEDNCSYWASCLEKVFETKEPYREIVRVDGRLGTVVLDWRLVPEFDDQGNVVTILSASRDITGLEKAEAALREREELFRAVFETAKDGIFIKDRSLRYVQVNRAMEEQVGVPVSEIIGRTSTDVLHSSKLHQFQEADWRVLAGEVVQHEISHDIDGRPQIVDMVEVPLRDANGEIVGLCGIVRDITERRRLEEQFRQAQKMETIGRLAGGIAHDFNNLLTAITGYAEFVYEALPVSDICREDVGQIIKAADRATSLTQQLLAFSRQQLIEPRVVNLNDLVANLDKMLRRLIGENIELTTRTQQDLGLVKADVAQVEQVLVNLVVNARDAMPSHITIETANAFIDENYVKSHTGAKVGEYVVLAVTDNGSGMTKEVQERLFEPFFTTKEKGKGTGLGLATVYGIVQQHNGNVWVYSEPGQGTTFKIYLPRVEGTSGKLPRRDEAGFLPLGSETILIVEDEPAVRSVAARILREQGYNVLEVSCGSDALKLMQERKEEIDLLLTDVIMPRMSGKELAERSISFCPNLKVLFVSGYTDDAIVHHGVLESGTSFLQKPFTASSLARKVRQVLDQERTGEREKGS